MTATCTAAYSTSKHLLNCATDKVFMHRLSETEIQALAARNCQNAVCILDLNLRLVWASPAFYKLTGRQPSQHEGLSLSEVLCNDRQTQQTISDSIGELLQHQGSEMELRAECAEGLPIIFKARMIEAEIEPHGLVGYVLQLHDVTLARQQEAEIQENRRELSEMFENSLVPMCYNEPSGTFVRVNKAFCELFECEASDLIGNDYLDLQFAQNSEQERRAIRYEAAEFLRSNKVYRKEFEITTRKNNKRHVELVMKNVRIAERQLVSVYLIDKTEKHQFETRILQQNEKLREFAFLTSHKLRQPLANIIGLIELVKSESDSNTNVSINMETLRMLTTQLDHVVHEMTNALTELDMEAEKSLYLSEPEPQGIHSVWIVDDDQVITYITQRLLQNADPTLEIQGFLSGKMALEKLRLDHSAPDMLLLDINMPGISGWEFLDELKLAGVDVNVFMYSSSIDPEDVKRARAYPMVMEFLSKPIDSNTIRRLLEVKVQRRKVG